MAQLSSIARPYAQAVFDLAQDTEDFGSWSDQLQLLSMIAANPQMDAIFTDPRIGRDATLQLVLDIGGDALNEQARNLVRILTQYRRLSVVPAIAEQYETLRAEAEGVVEAEIESARPVSPEHEQVVAEALEARLGRKVRLRSVVNEELIGGAVIRAGDWVIDGSVRARLNKLASALGV